MPGHRLATDLGLQHGAPLKVGDKLFFIPAAGRHLLEIGTGDPTTTSNTGMIYINIAEASDDSFAWHRLGDGSAYGQAFTT